jgi:phospholipid/cholesterol/gamma-HCH transport system substrate-binding protein
MQSLKKALRNPITLGVCGLAFATVVALVVAALYISPPGHKIIIFYTDDAASIRPGDEVRMAGITVGTVKDLTLESNQVRVRATVKNDAFVGDRSHVDVRMLTVVGGYYVNIASDGDRSLASSPIPLDRVKMPYSLIRTLADATKITQRVETKPINESLNQIQQGLTGANVETLSAIIDAGNSLMSTVDRQRGQITAILNMSDEYIASLNNYRDELVQLVDDVSIVVQTLTLYSKRFGAALDGIGDVMVALKPVGDFYDNHRDDLVQKIREWQHRVRLFVDRNGLTVRVLHRVQNLFERVLDAQNARPELLATDLCIPVAGSPC